MNNELFDNLQAVFNVNGTEIDFNVALLNHFLIQNEEIEVAIAPIEVAIREDDYVNIFEEFRAWFYHSFGNIEISEEILVNEQVEMVGSFDEFENLFIQQENVIEELIMNHFVSLLI